MRGGRSRGRRLVSDGRIMVGNQRRALRHVSGPVTTGGDRLRAAALQRALEATDKGEEDGLTHGFHAYPARMHPALARSVLEDLVDPGTRVLDPFCGGGTVLVEARRVGAEAFGVDLNPLAVRLAEVKAAGLSRKQARVLRARIDEVVSAVPDRRGDRAPLSREEARWFEPHVLAEMAALRAQLTSRGAKWEQRALLIVLSSMVVKMSCQRADTDDQVIDKRIRKGFVTEFFGNKAREFVRRACDVAAEVPPKTPPPRVIEGDARELPKLLGRTRVDLILTSPPYGGTYDYVDHHARRYPWLGVDPGQFATGEMGARRRMTDASPERWDQELGDALRAMAAVVRPGAPTLLLLGDGEIGGRRVSADVQVERLAPASGLKLLAVASQARRDWKGGTPRREHLLWLEPG